MNWEGRDSAPLVLFRSLVVQVDPHAQVQPCHQLCRSIRMLKRSHASSFAGRSACSSAAMPPALQVDPHAQVQPCAWHAC
eukprot:357494-Chlamydomonas_euryale.AAC.12